MPMANEWSQKDALAAKVSARAFKEKTNEGIRPKFNKNLHKFVFNTFLVWKFTGKGTGS